MKQPPRFFSGSRFARSLTPLFLFWVLWLCYPGVHVFGQELPGDTKPLQILQDEALYSYQMQLEPKFQSLAPVEGIEKFGMLAHYWEKRGMKWRKWEAQWYLSYFSQLLSPSEANVSLFLQSISRYAESYHSDANWDRMIRGITTWYKKQDFQKYGLKAFLMLVGKDSAHIMGKRIYDCYYHIGMLRYYEPDYRKSIDNFMRVIREKEEIKPDLYANACLYLGWAYRYHGEYDSALIYLNYFADYLDSGGSLAARMEAKKFIANVYELQGKYYLALSEYLDVLRKEQKAHLEETSAWTLNAIGNVYLNLGDLNAAEEYLKEGLRIYKKFNIDHGIATSHRDLGDLYLKKGIFELALSHHLKALEIRRKRNRHGYAESLNAIAEIYIKMGNLTAGLDYLRQALMRGRATGMRKAEHRTLLAFADIMFKMPKHERKDYLVQFGFRNIHELIERISFLNREVYTPENYLHSLLILSTYYEQTGNTIRSLEYLKGYNAFKDSIFNAHQIIQIQDLKNKQLLAGKEEQISRLEFDRQRKELELERQKNLTEKTQIIWAAGLFVLLLTFLFLIQRMRDRQKRKEAIVQLEIRKQAEIERHKGEFFANMTHEFRTPLTLIDAPLQMLLKEPANKMQRELLQIISRNSKRLKRLSYQILEINKIKNKRVKALKREANFSELIRCVYNDFLPLARREKIALEMELPDKEIFAQIDPDLIEEVLLNLLSNAMKFTLPGNAIRIKLNFSDQGLELIVRDEGKGMSEAVRRRIFDRYYSESNKSKNYSEGTGLGLSIAKAYAEAHNGEIQAESEEGAGTTMKVKLPVEYTLRGSEESGIDAPDIQLPEILEETKHRQDEIRILLVEDNADLRYFIDKSVLAGYQLLLARNGIEGMKLARNMIPDLIISDIMMPDMDGMELLDQVKQFEETDHIPFIFLTAKATASAKLEGIRQGADAYIEKPFSAEELRYRVRNMLNRMQKLRERYASAQVGSKTEDKHPYLIKVERLIARHLDDHTFNVSELCAMLNLSRSQLHRKIKALTGLGPNKFIRNYRLIEARRIIQSGHANIAEVSYQTGFTSPSYFTKCFKELFGVAPSEISVS